MDFIGHDPLFPLIDEKIETAFLFIIQDYLMLHGIVQNLKFILGVKCSLFLS